MVDRVPLFHTQNIENQECIEQLKPEMDPRTMKEIKAAKKKYRKDVYKYWGKVFPIVIVLVYLFGAVFAPSEKTGLYTLVKEGRIVTLFEVLFRSIIYCGSIAGLITMFYCGFSFYMRIGYSMKAWGPPFPAYDSAPIETMQMMNTQISRNMKNYDLLVGLILGLVAYLIPRLLSILEYVVIE